MHARRHRSPAWRWAMGSLLLLATAAALVPARARASSGGKWEYVSSSDGVRVYRKRVPGSSVFAFKGEMVADIPIGKIVSTYADVSLRRDWVDRWYADAELSMKTPSDRVFWIRFGLPWPISDRDYVLHLKAAFDDAKREFTARLSSVRHPAKPEQSCCVRGVAFGTFYRFTAIPGTKRTKLYVEVHTDPRGMLPAWLVNLIQKDWPRKTLVRLAARARMPDIPIAPRVAAWHKPVVTVP